MLIIKNKLFPDKKCTCFDNTSWYDTITVSPQNIIEGMNYFS